MYAENGLIFPYFHSFSPDVHQFVDFGYSNKLDNVVQSSTISDYDLGGEGDLFNAPEPIIDQPLTILDPMTAAMSRISCGEDDLSPQELNLTDMESLQNEEFFSNVFHEYKDIIEKKTETETETSPVSEVFHEYKDKPNFLNITVADLGNIYVIRRAFSEGDIETLSNGNGSHINSSPGQQQLMNEHTIEDRRQKLSRYRNKKAKRNFGRKIKYACRKALADNQPRIRGRFAKTEESEILGGK